MNDIKSDVMRLDAIKDEMGKDRFWNAVNKLRRWKIMNRLREKKQDFNLKDYQRMHRSQRGKCGICGEQMNFPYRSGHGLAIDHRDPNRQDCDNPKNLQLVHHDPCNLQKGSASIPMQAKSTGKPYTQLI